MGAMVALGFADSVEWIEEVMEMMIPSGLWVEADQVYFLSFRFVPSFRINIISSQPHKSDLN